MDYIVTNIVGQREIRISNQQMEGRILYQGHKLAMPDELLSYILFYTQDRSKGCFHFLDYKKWKEIYDTLPPTSRSNECWFQDTDNKRALILSYNTLLDSLSDIVGRFKTIYVIET